MTPSLIPKLIASLLAAITAVIFCVAEGGPIPLVVLPAALVAMLVVDTGPKRALPGWLATLAGMVAIGLSVAEFFSEDLEGRLLSGGHLLSYLTTIVLLIRKSLGDLYRLLTLCGLQIALSSVLTNEFWLGPSLLLFMAVAIFLLTTLLWERLSASSQGSRNQAVQTRAELRLTGPALAFTLAAFVAACGIFLFLPRIWIGSVQMFNNDTAPGGGSQVGFTDEVKLGDIGEILESDEPVMEIRTVNPVTNLPVRLEDYYGRLGSTEPLFRGAALDQYRDGQWLSSSGLGKTEAPVQPRDESSQYRHEIYLHPIGSQRLFNLGPNQGLAKTDGPLGVLLQKFEMTLARPQASPLTEPIRYTLWTPKDPKNGASPVVLYSQVNSRGQFRRRIGILQYVEPTLRAELIAYLRTMPELAEIYAEAERAVGQYLLRKLREERVREVGPERYQSDAEVRDRIETDIRELASDAALRERALRNVPLIAIRQASDADFSSFEIAEAIAAHFDRPEFTYTLSADVSDPSIDPILDFLRNRKTGHCEYYASGQTLLLQAAGVPARLISGFKGGVQEDERYLVSQLHAHAWVEAYHSDPDKNRPHWFTYDPTPATRASSVAENRAAAEARRRNPLVLMKDIWKNGIFMTRTQQQQFIYEPMLETTRETYTAVRNFPAALGAVFNREGRALSAEDRDSLRGVGRLVAVLLTLIAIAFGIRQLRRRAARGGSKKESYARPYTGAPTPWYDRFLKLAAVRLGRPREQAATHDEYADDVGDGVPEMKAVADTVTEEYYRVRFGRKVARPAVLSDVESQLDRTEQAANR